MRPGRDWERVPYATMTAPALGGVWSILSGCCGPAVLSKRNGRPLGQLRHLECSSPLHLALLAIRGGHEGHGHPFHLHRQRKNHPQHSLVHSLYPLTADFERDVERTEHIPAPTAGAGKTAARTEDWVVKDRGASERGDWHPSLHEATNRGSWPYYSERSDATNGGSWHCY